MGGCVGEIKEFAGENRASTDARPWKKPDSQGHIANLWETEEEGDTGKRRFSRPL